MIRSLLTLLLLLLSREGSASESDRMIAYVGNWQACPTSEQTASYTELLIAFAVTYQWSPGKNICNTQCVIGSPVPICNNQPNAALVSQWQAQGKKVILSFGGAGMGGSWSSSNDDCWEHCFGKEDFVVDQLTNIVSVQGFDGIDIDYEYYYENGQKGSSFSKGAEAQRFLREVTRKLRSRLPAGKIVSHAPMDSDMVKGTGYYNVIKSVAGDLDFLMPQYYNGVVRPETAFTTGDQTALTHFTDLVDDVFSGDATKVTFGFCISDCPGYNIQSSSAVQVVQRMTSHFPCNGGVFFWVATHDTQGQWSKTVAAELSSTCGNATPKPPTPRTPAPRSTPRPPTPPSTPRPPTPPSTPRPPTPPSTPRPPTPPVATPRPNSGARCRIWNSCGATPDCCPSGTSCFSQDRYYSQCRPTCPRSWECNNRPPTPPNPPTTPRPPTTTPRPPRPPTTTPRPQRPPTVTPRPSPVTPTSSPGTVGPNLCSQRIGEWGGCGAAPYCCANGLKCFEQSRWYAQCGKTCTGGSCRDLGKMKDSRELGRLGQEAPVCNNCRSWQRGDAYCTGSAGCGNIPNSGTCMAGERKCFGSSQAAASARKVITFVLKNGASAFDRSEFERMVRSGMRSSTAKVMLKYLCPSSVCPGGRCADPFGAASKCLSHYDISSGRFSILEGNAEEGSVVAFEIEGSDEGLIDAYNEKQFHGVVAMHEEWQVSGYDKRNDTTSSNNSSLLMIIVAAVTTVVGCVMIAAGVMYYRRTHQPATTSTVEVVANVGDDDDAFAAEGDVLSKTTTANKNEYQFQI